MLRAEGLTLFGFGREALQRCPEVAGGGGDVFGYFVLRGAVGDDLDEDDGALGLVEYS